MSETAVASSAQGWRRPPTPAMELFKQRFWVNCWIDGKKIESIELALQHYLQPLKDLAEDEDWGADDNILVNYFVYTFYYLDQFHQTDRSMGYLKEHNDAIHFHTGLFTVRMEPIFACFPINKNPGNKSTVDRPQYFFNPNRLADHFLLSAQMTGRCYPLPVRCHYFTDYTRLIMDGTKKPEVDWTHIVDTNWERVCRALYPDEDPHDLSFKASAQVKVTSELCGALELACRRVEANYRTAVPQFYNSKLQLLLPLCVRDSRIPDLVLTIERKPFVPPIDGMFTYVGATILTIQMAYQNARLIARPEHDWLIAPETPYDDFEVDQDVDQFYPN